MQGLLTRYVRHADPVSALIFLFRLAISMFVCGAILVATAAAVAGAAVIKHSHGCVVAFKLLFLLWRYLHRHLFNYRSCASSFEWKNACEHLRQDGF